MMFRPAAFFIGLRYTRAKRRNHFISFISLASMIGIALGVAVLITVLSVMNGFDKEIKNRVFSMVPPITVSSHLGSVSEWQELQNLFKQNTLVLASAPFVTGEVLLSYGSSVQPALLNGILPDQEKNIYSLADKMIKGHLTNLTQGQFHIVLGETLANQLGADIGDKITIVTPQVSLSPAGVMPRFKRFTVTGIFRAGTGFGFDRGLSFVNLSDAQKLFGLNNNVTGLHIRVQDVYQAPLIAKQLQNSLSESAIVTTWADQFGEFFHAIQLEKTMMFFILLLIIAVAAFSLVSTLVMVVSEKESDIAILRTFGATPHTIMSIFIVQGAVIGIFGSLLGIIGGLLLAYNATDIVNAIEHIFHVQFLSSNVYFVNYLPSEVKISDIVKIGSASLIMSLLATIYPAWRASRLDPVESLRYE